MSQNNDSPSRGSGSGLDTGTGGFPIDDKLYSYDVGVDDDGTGPRPSWSSGQVKVNNANKDLSKGTMKTMASYLSRTTLGSTESSPTQAKNAYAVRHGENVDPTLFSLQDIDGRPTRPSETSNIEKFIDGKTVTGKSDAATNLPEKLKGHTLLKDATPTAPAASAIGGKFTPSMKTSKPFVKDDKGNYPNESAAIIGNYYGDSRTLSNSVIYNRFNADNGNTYSEKGAGLTQFQFASKYSMGTSEADRNMSHGRLAQIGNALSIRAGLELTSTQENNNPTGNAATAAAFLPGAAQLGVMRIERDTLTARSVIDDGLFDSIDTDLLIDPAAESWGTLNNVLDHYAGISNFGMQLLSVALVAALGIAVAGFMLLFSFRGDTDFERAEFTGQRFYGASAVSPSDPGAGGVTEIARRLLSGQLSIWQLLGIQPTFNKFEKCLPVGALQFFGITSNSSEISFTDFAGEVASKGLISAAQNPGFYAVMARSFNRSFVLLTDYFKNLAAAFGSGFVAGITQIFSIIDVLRSSKFIKFLNIFGQLGDKNIGPGLAKNPFGPAEIEQGVRGFGQKFISDIDKAAATAAGKGRIKLGECASLTQARSAYLAPDLLLMPNIYKEKFLDDPRFTPVNPVKKVILTTEDNASFDGRLLATEGRISSDTRKSMEASLESEYVPFYLHDIRTNEIISFHAFLTSLSDGYTVSYESTEAIGRVEPIKTYKGTTRKIGFSFILAAFSPEDEQVMWMKINKLSTMVYPQFTEGRKLTQGNYSISAPFSQSISAAPLVRVRIGDLIQSNYSKFALARLFGMYYSDSVLDGKTPNGTKPEKTYEKAFKEQLKEGNTFLLKTGCFLPTEKIDAANLLKQRTLSKELSKLIHTLTLPPNAELKIKEVNNEDNFCICTVVEKVATTTDSTNASGPVANAVSAIGAQIKRAGDVLKKQLPTTGSDSLIGRQFKIEKNSLIPTAETERKIQAAITASKPADANASYGDNVKKFMNETNGNAISKSFKSVGGKGLPGFIESLEFDWYDKVTWNTRDEENPYEHRAPKMCKITISFAPFHDITPGLDHVGFNRAPIYPIGPMAPQGEGE